MTDTRWARRRCEARRYLAWSFGISKRYALAPKLPSSTLRVEPGTDTKAGEQARRYLAWSDTKVGEEAGGVWAAAGGGGGEQARGKGESKK